MYTYIFLFFKFQNLYFQNLFIDIYIPVIHMFRDIHTHPLLKYRNAKKPARQASARAPQERKRFLMQNFQDASLAQRH